ncbi:UDP-N-acetylenolpyruvoylglucosamine reductase [Flexistipes sinusarabici DSM 4947]|uniref:UDP-N-acetylenolpyruvoylglucosamine reductase n=1 Tax=Flexistipes sinusarabici (strain ATCC 49648 / DSM 4947 / MAS 10) TaxID=717231 RepID=F8E3T8_FLESM|nr:UDP-N-acetylmuramate dehydrogenase [Flexistipes sinusarabici]AEI15440.1 UDP-N-acetylenolpyruvoylglucosamine reductase [Flexistipes sinusarabici DSM 4947]
MKLISENVFLKDYYFYRAGGTARYLACPKTAQELSGILEWRRKKKVSYTLIGAGSNVLFSDDLFDGLVIVLAGLNRWIVRSRQRVICGAGVPLHCLIEFTALSGLAGLENLYGIPGSTGGSCLMNAGAFGSEISDNLEKVEVLDSEGRVLTLSRGEIEFGYRKSSLDGYIVLSAEFLLKYADPMSLRKKIDLRASKRDEKQPVESCSCGSVFKRPENNYAGTLIESCGLKGLRIGDAEVSEKHANFIINRGNATSLDIYRLIKYVKDVVYRQKGVLLEEEVKLINF